MPTDLMNKTNSIVLDANVLFIPQRNGTYKLSDPHVQEIMQIVRTREKLGDIEGGKINFFLVNVDPNLDIDKVMGSSPAIRDFLSALGAVPVAANELAQSENALAKRGNVRILTNRTKEFWSEHFGVNEDLVIELLKGVGNLYNVVRGLIASFYNIGETVIRGPNDVSKVDNLYKYFSEQA
jgi:hypothetical protein